MPSINLQDKKFRMQTSSENGEVNAATIFHYRQKNNIVWATYEGGDILFGTLSGSIKDDHLTFNYQHQNLDGVFMTGKCRTRIEISDQKIVLHEEWQWTCADNSSGYSVLEEL